MSDFNEKFRVVTKEEWKSLKSMKELVKRLSNELSKCVLEKENLLREINKLKKLLSQKSANSSLDSVGSNDYPDLNMVNEFIQNQGFAKTKSSVCVNAPHSTAGRFSLVRLNTTDNYCFQKGMVNDNDSIASGVYQSPLASTNDNMFPSKKRAIDVDTKENFYNFNFECRKAILKEQNCIMANEMDKLAKLLVVCKPNDVIVNMLINQYKKLSRETTQIEIFQRFLNVFISQGVIVTICHEHQPPCKPSVKSRVFDVNCQMFKKFMDEINKKKQLAVEVELLLALENFVFTNVKYKHALMEIFDILFRHGIVSAPAFSKWSETNNNCEKNQLLNYLFNNGFCLIRKPSLY